MTDQDICSRTGLPVDAAGHRCCHPNGELVQLYKALAHPVRLMILTRLAADHHRCCGDICSELPLAQSTVSQHLKVLREAGFIEHKACGQHSHYKLNAQGIALLKSQSEQFFQSLDSASHVS
ncbi:MULTISPECIES: ArsR/SmtB family transcription factor [Cohaesibacter]|uniref:ArsR/SmtB family transcription factor n=1 Tax=Cohaesibacter TaxID=655352 RepID=UPI000DEAE754|nr:MULTISPECIES: metalloregulator ArsR/SmtB family transcription factor [Cohaesibacter]TLP48898.1 helix-turn-helix transcriptional regulator [Cohaesibacter sp. CAU 1516]